MDRKELDNLLDYLPVIVTTCDRYGWCGGRGAPVSNHAPSDVRLFFEYIQGHVPLGELPELEDTMGSTDGEIVLLWETEVDPEEVTYDSFSLGFRGDGEIQYRGNLESIGISVLGETLLGPELNSDIIEHIKFFQRKQNEQRKVQEPTALKSNSNKRMQQKV